MFILLYCWNRRNVGFDDVESLRALHVYGIGYFICVLTVMRWLRLRDAVCVSKRYLFSASDIAM